MKCDELKQYEVFVSNPYNTGGSFREIAVLPADKVDAAIAELKEENKILKEHIANGDVSRITWIDEVIELKQKLHDLEMRADRDLWIMTAEWAEGMGLASCNIAIKLSFKERFFHYDEANREKDIKKYRHRQVVFYKYADYCRAKAEEYK